MKRVISQQFGRWKRKNPQSYRRLLPYVSQWEKVFLGHIASHNGCGHCNTTVWPLCQFCFNSQRTSWGLETSTWHQRDYIHILYSLWEERNNLTSRSLEAQLPTLILYWLRLPRSRHNSIWQLCLTQNQPRLDNEGLKRVILWWFELYCIRLWELDVFWIIDGLYTVF